jgi:hypothetical protein
MASLPVKQVESDYYAVALLCLREGSEGEIREWNKKPMTTIQMQYRASPALFICYKLMCIPQLAIADLTVSSVEMHGLHRFTKRGKHVTALVPSHSSCTLTIWTFLKDCQK